MSVKVRENRAEAATTKGLATRGFWLTLFLQKKKTTEIRTIYHLDDRGRGGRTNTGVYERFGNVQRPCTVYIIIVITRVI